MEPEVYEIRRKHKNTSVTVMRVLEEIVKTSGNYDPTKNWW